MVSSREMYLSFALGCSFGIFIYIIFRELAGQSTTCSLFQTYNRIRKNQYHNAINYEEDSNALFIDPDDYHDNEFLPPPRESNKPHAPIVFNDQHLKHHMNGNKVAKKLERQVRVLCWVMTMPGSLETKAQAVKDTWGKRCNVLLFMSSKEDKRLPAIGLNVPEGRENLWLKTRAAWKYVYDNHFDDADWFMKADDDTFVVVENLRYLLSQHNTSDPRFFGRHFKTFGGYNSGGAGYVFSKETLIRFYKVMKDPDHCKLKAGAEDVEVGVCLSNMDVHPSDSRDEHGRETFHPFGPEMHLIPGRQPPSMWIHQYNKYEVVEGLGCCSDHTIAFHYINPHQMYVMEYLIYHLHPYGITFNDK